MKQKVFSNLYGKFRHVDCSPIYIINCKSQFCATNLPRKLVGPIHSYQWASQELWAQRKPHATLPFERRNYREYQLFWCRCIDLIYNCRSNEMTVFPSLHTHCLSFSASLIAVYKFCHSVGLPFITGNIAAHVNGRRFPIKEL